MTFLHLTPLLSAPGAVQSLPDSRDCRGASRPLGAQHQSSARRGDSFESRAPGRVEMNNEYNRIYENIEIPFKKHMTTTWCAAHRRPYGFEMFRAYFKYCVLCSSQWQCEQ